MVFIIMTAIIIYLILIAWTWQSLGFVDRTKKIAVIVMGIVAMYIITFIIFQMTKAGLNYQNVEMQKSVQNILVAIFTGINGMILMPQIGKILDKINEEQIEKRELKKRIIVLGIVFIICLIFEVGYIKDTQEGILRMYQAMG